MGKRALTLIEIIVSMVVLALVVTGLTQVFLGARKFSIHSRSRAAAIQLSKFMLDALPVEVNASTWDLPANGLTNSTPGGTGGFLYCDSDAATNDHPGCPPAVNRTIDTILYNANYSISDTAGARKVTLKIFWNETATK